MEIKQVAFTVDKVFFTRLGGVNFWRNFTAGRNKHFE